MRIFLVFIFLLLLNACQQTVSSSHKTTAPQDGVSEELAFNHLLLKYFYLNADKELKSASSYHEQSEATEPYASHPYGDVYYMYESLSDEFTNYFDPTFADAILSQLLFSPEEASLGMEVNSSLIVALAYENAPAYRAGIREGDSITTINGETIEDYQAYETALFSESTAGSRFRISVSRGGEPQTYQVTSAVFNLPTVYLTWVENIPVIRVTEFTETTSHTDGTAGEFSEALEKTDDANSIVIDLRGNPGGSIDQCVDMASQLIPQGKILIQLVSYEANRNLTARITDTTVYRSKHSGTANRYYVLLADEGSASCSEILMSALVENLETPIVGNLSYGKGVGQSYLMTEAGGVAGITSIAVFDKHGESYHRYGFVPDFKINDPEAALEKAVELAAEGTYRRTAGYGTTEREFSKALPKSRARILPKKGGAFKFIPKPE
ncbi:MAG: PDZ domain-containing protein [Fibrobacter sp.]|jgi:C-terminal peptidase prc|nr:PDZ domain-containing protein [Fibrobacter sp.]